MKLLLLSTEGERHEDRLPEGIFSSLDKIKKYIAGNNTVQFREFIEESDYSKSAIKLYVYYYTDEYWNKLTEWNLDNE